MTAPSPPDRWDRIADLFDGALALAPAERSAWLASRTSDDQDLGREVEAMLESHEDGAQLELEERLLAGAAAELGPGTAIASYRVRRFLGRGGMGEVYLAERSGAGYEHLVAIKLLRSTVAGADAAIRFRREQRILARLSHPAIVPLLDSGIHSDGRPFLVLQYVDGLPITRFADERQLGVDDRLRLFVAVCRAVQFAHGRLVVHRDLKPSNILVTAEGDVRLLDFGVAKALTPEEDELGELTRLVAPMTPERAAPEQLRGEPASTSTDVWALGVLLTELLVGRLPFRFADRSPAAIERQLSREAAPRPSAAVDELASSDSSAVTAIAAARATTSDRLRERLRGDLDSVASMALRWEPERRYGSAGQLADDVERVLAGHPVMARPASVAYRLRRFFGRHPVGTTAAVVALVALLAFTATAVRQSARLALERDRAAAEEAKANATVDLLVGILGGANPTEGASGDSISIGDLLARGEKQADESASQPAIQARLWRTLGKIHFERSANEKARDLLQRALDRELEIGSADDPHAIEAALDLALAESSLGEKAAAEARLRSLVERLDSSNPPADPALLAAALHQLSEVVPREAGEELARRALAIRRELSPPRPIPVADSLNAVGVHALQRGDRQSAAELFRESLALLKPALGEDHPWVLAVANNLGVVTSDPVEQETLYRRMIEIQTRRFGDVSGPVANSWNNLGTALATRGVMKEAIPAFRAAYQRWSVLHGPDHPQVLNTRSNIARALDLTEDSESSLVEYTGILAAVERGEIDPETKASYRVQTALTLLHLGRLAEAKEMASKALATLVDLVPVSDPTRISAHATLGLVLLAESSIDAAEREIAVAHDGCRSIAAGDPRCAGVEVMLGQAWIAQGRTAEGLALMTRSFDTFSRWGLAHPSTVAAARRAIESARSQASP